MSDNHENIENKTMKINVNRRNFIRTSSALLALPWLESLAGASEASPAKRLVCLNADFGFHGPAFFPEQGGRDYETSEYLKIIDELRDDFTVFSGISHPDIGGDHHSGLSFLSAAKGVKRAGYRNTVSMDYLASKHVGTATRFPLLAMKTVEGGFSMSITPSGAPVRTHSRPSQLYAAMFLAGNPKQVEAEIQRLRNGQSILDRMGDRLKSLQRRLGPNDQRQLSDYTDAVREMEKQLHANEEWAKRPKPVVDEPRMGDNPDPLDLVGRTRTMFQLIRLALQTDSTRVCSLVIRGCEGKPTYLPVGQGHHGLTHHGQNPTKIKELKVIEKAKMMEFKTFLTALKDTREGGSSLLHNTQVLLGSNLGNASGHTTTNLPILLAGGGWKHGQHIAGNVKDNTPLCNLFVSMMQRFGMEVEQFGSSTRTMTGLV